MADSFVVRSAFSGLLQTFGGTASAVIFGTRFRQRGIAQCVIFNGKLPGARAVGKCLNIELGICLSRSLPGTNTGTIGPFFMTQSTGKIEVLLRNRHGLHTLRLDPRLLLPQILPQCIRYC